MKNVLVTIGVVFVVIIGVVFMGFSYKNTAIKLEEGIKTAESNINSQYKRRDDLIPNLVATVKDYNKYEYDTLMKIVEARKTNYTEEDIKNIQNAVRVVAEQYPQLQANTNYNQLMTELANTENLVFNYRSAYNESVRSYNSYIQAFPNSFFLGITGYAIKSYNYLNFENVSENAPNVGDLLK